jgi:DNA-directed RNA polymerase subunit E'/Rpb7
MTILIQRRVCLEPRFLDSNIRQHILNKVSNDTTEECTQEHGYILEILHLVRIVSSEGTIFLVELEAETFKPVGGAEVEGTVCMVYHDGIFINIRDKQKMLIPTSTLPEHSFDEVTRAFHMGDTTIMVGDTVRAVVTAAKYSNGKFSCFGSLA